MKGNPKLLMRGYSYFRNNGNMDRTYWLCSKNRYLKCNARIITKSKSKEVIIKNQDHNHEPDYSYNNDDEDEEETECYTIAKDVD